MNGDPGQRSRSADPGAAVRPSWTALAAVASASLAACVAVDLFYFSRATISGDEDRFLRAAAHLLATGEFRVGGDVAWEMPGTALFFAPFLYLFPGAELTAIRIAQGLLVAVQSALIGVLATLIFRDRRAGLAAALIAGFYPYLIFTQGLALSETLFIFLLVAGFLCLYLWRTHGARIDGMMGLTLLVFTLATLTKATLTVLPPMLMAAAAAGVQSAGGVLRVFAVAAAIYCLLMSPWWLRNYLALGAFVPFTTSSTMNLYTGNSPNNPQALAYDMPADWAVDRGVDLRAIPGELDRYRAYGERALVNIVEQPFEFLRRAWIKFKRFWSLVPNAPQYQTPLYRLIGLATFGSVLLFAMVCLFQQRGQFLLLLPFYLTVCYFTALYVVTLASIRYRLPLEPLLIVLAADPIARLTRRLVPARAAHLEAIR